MIKILATALLLVCIVFQSAAVSPMTKNDLIAYVAEAAKLSPSDAAAAVDAVFDTITEALVSGDRVLLGDFGFFFVNPGKARQGRNTRTGETFIYTTSRVPKFQPGNALKGAVNQPELASQDGTGEKCPLSARFDVSNLPDTTPYAIAHVAEAAKLSPSDAAVAVDAVFDTITEALASGDRVSIVGFGSFIVVFVPARQTRDVATGKQIFCLAYRSPIFKPDKYLDAAVNK